MHIDPYTVILFGLLLKVPLAVLFLAFWLRGRRAIWFAWWSATLFLGSVAMLCFLVGGLRKEYVPIGAANAVLAVALVCAWQGARAFEKRAHNERFCGVLRGTGPSARVEGQLDPLRAQAHQ